MAPPVDTEEGGQGHVAASRAFAGCSVLAAPTCGRLWDTAEDTLTSCGALPWRQEARGSWAGADLVRSETPGLFQLGCGGCLPASGPNGRRFGPGRPDSALLPPCRRRSLLASCPPSPVTKTARAHLCTLPSWDGAAFPSTVRASCLCAAGSQLALSHGSCCG